MAYVFADGDTYAGRDVALRTIAVQGQHQVLLVSRDVPARRRAALASQ